MKVLKNEARVNETDDFDLIKIILISKKGTEVQDGIDIKKIK